MPSSRSTIPEDTERASRRHGIAYTATTVLLTALMAITVLDGASVLDAVGVDTYTTSATADGYTLSVKGASVSRPALATPFEITVTRPDGFDAPVEVGISTDYLNLFDYQRMYPEPSSEHTRGELTVMEFDPPDGTSLIVAFDWRMEPAVQSGRKGRVAVLEDGDVAVEVTTELSVRP